MLRVLIIALLTLTSFTSQAVPIELNIQGDRLQWLSAIPNQGERSPAYWALSPQLDAAKKFTQITITGSQSFNVSRGSTSVPLAISFTGMEYYNSSSWQLSSYPGAGNSAASKIGAIASFAGTGRGDRMVVMSGGQSITPFTQFRPIFAMDEADIKNSFKTVSATEGRYVGQVTLNVTYEYERLNGALSRRMIPLTLMFSIYYQPAEITNIQLSSSTQGKMTTFYQGRSYVSGMVDYIGRVTGTLPQGVKMTFPNTNSFEMQGPNNTTIPVSIICNGCTDSLLVDDGAKVIQKTTIPSPVSTSTTIQFNLSIKFDNKPLDVLENGSYQGTVYLLFEPEV